MNAVINPPLWTPEAQVIDAALSALRASTGVVGEINQASAADDHEVSLHVAGTRLRYVCTIKQNIDRAALLDDLKARASRPNTLLICTALTNTMAARCQELDMQFIDTAGNAYLTNKDGILINVRGRKAERTVSIHADKTITPAALRMMFAFLAKPSMLNAPYRDISAAVHVATGAIGKALEALETRGLIGTTARARRIINSPELMLSEWATGYTSRIKPKLKKIRFTAPNPAGFLSEWAPEMQRSAWGGEVAAEKVTKHLNPATATIYMASENTRDLPEMVKRFKLRGDPNGTIEVVQAFWNMDVICDDFPTVPLHLIYADLLGTNDPRNLLVAKQIYQQVLDHVRHSET